MQKKICCIRSLEEAQIAIKAGADAVGFVGIYPPTPRTISDELIYEIIREIPRSIATVLLTASTSGEAIAAQLQQTGANSVQLAAEIEADELQLIARRKPDVKRIKVVHVEGMETLQALRQYCDSVDAFLLDSGNPKASTPVYGGTGRKHDWSVSAEFVKLSPLPVFLAGGLTPQNVAKAIDQASPDGVDLCSGVRTNDRLDRKKLSAFMSAIQ